MSDTHLITKEHAHADYSAAHEPVLTVDPGTGERLTFETDDAAYAQMEELRDIAKVTATINPVTGPVHVTGAEPGDTLAVTIHDIEMAEHGVEELGEWDVIRIEHEDERLVGQRERAIDLPGLRTGHVE